MTRVYIPKEYALPEEVGGNADDTLSTWLNTMDWRGSNLTPYSSGYMVKVPHPLSMGDVLDLLASGAEIHDYACTIYIEADSTSDPVPEYVPCSPSWGERDENGNLVNPLAWSDLPTNPEEGTDRVYRDTSDGTTHWPGSVLAQLLEVDGIEIVPRERTNRTESEEIRIQAKRDHYERLANGWSWLGTQYPLLKKDRDGLEAAISTLSDFRDKVQAIVPLPTETGANSILGLDADDLLDSTLVEMRDTMLTMAQAVAASLATIDQVVYTDFHWSDGQVLRLTVPEGIKIRTSISLFVSRSFVQRAADIAEA